MQAHVIEVLAVGFIVWYGMGWDGIGSQGIARDGWIEIAWEWGHILMGRLHVHEVEDGRWSPTRCATNHFSEKRLSRDGNEWC